MVSTQKESGVQYHPTVTQNGHTERDNLLVALAGGQHGEEGTTHTPKQAGLPKKPTPQGKLEDTLTWARDTGR